MLESCWRDECAVMAVSLPEGRDDAAKLLYDGLRIQQHRGQDGSGIVLVSGENMIVRKETGLVYEVFPPEWIEQNRSPLGIAHNRYSTQGVAAKINLQPHSAQAAAGTVSVAGNGHLPYYQSLRQSLEAEREIFETTNDGELLAKIIARETNRTGCVVTALCGLSERVKGAYSAVMLFAGKLYAFRDPYGFRPLNLAEIPGGGIAVASETVAFDILGCDPETYQEVSAGSILEITAGKVVVHEEGHPAKTPCIFEFIYFARPDSEIFGWPVALVRRRIGWQLAQQLKLKAEIVSSSEDEIIVIAVPDSSTEIALGVSEGLNLPFEPGIIRSHTARRTFIENEQRIRDEGVRYKFNPSRLKLKGRRVIVVDDSIVRGSTNRKLITMLRRAGPKSIHLAIGSPQIKWSCFMGIDTPRLEELIANQRTFEDEVRFLNADSLTHLTLEGLMRTVGPLTEEERGISRRLVRPLIEAESGTYYARMWQGICQAEPERYCFACFSGRYPLPVPLPNATIISE